MADLFDLDIATDLNEAKLPIQTVNGVKPDSKGNIAITSVANATNATNAGNADTLDGYHHDSFPKVNSALFTVNGLASPGWSAIGTGKGGSCIQVTTTDNTYPSICFHRAGYSHCVLAEYNGELGTMQEGDGTFNYLITSANIGLQRVNYANGADDAVRAYSLRTNSHANHFLQLNWNDIGQFNCYVLAPDGGTRDVRVARANNADHATSADSATNATNATKATQDSAGQQINTTYIKGVSVSGRTVTFTRGNNTTFAITTQDTNTSYGISKLGTRNTGGTWTLTGVSTTKPLFIFYVGNSQNASNCQIRVTSGALDASTIGLYILGRSQGYNESCIFKPTSSTVSIFCANNVGDDDYLEAWQ